MKYFVYLARCADSSLYVGSCNDIKSREVRHNKGEGAQYTKKRLPVKIIYFEEFDTVVEARRRESQIKSWTRIKKENLVKFGHPTKKLFSMPKRVFIIHGCDEYPQEGGYKIHNAYEGRKRCS